MKSNSLKPRVLLKLLSPSIAIAMSYLLVGQLPLRREHSDLQANIHKLSSMTGRIDFQRESEKLTLAQDEISSLTFQLSENQEFLTRYVTKGNSAGGVLDGRKAPATTIADLLSLLQRHGLQCVSTVPTSKRETKPKAETLAVVDRVPVTLDRAGRQLQLQISGSFESMQTALHELASGSIAAQVVALEMADATQGNSEITNQRWWTMTVLLTGSHP